eukprot:gene3756-4676_t
MSTTTCCTSVGDENHHDSHYSAGQFWLGENTLKVPLVLHKENRQRLAQSVLQNHKEVIQPNSFILLEGGKATTLYDSDAEPLFKQEKYFFWAFGADIPDCYGIIALDSEQNPTSTLVIPKLPAEYATWMGDIHGKDHYKTIFLVDNVIYSEELSEFFTQHKTSTIYTVSGVNTDSGNKLSDPHFTGIQNFHVNNSLIYNDISECRVIKTEKEIEVLRYAVKATCEAHKSVMKLVRPGMKEYQSESHFLHTAYQDWGCRHVGYTCICAANKNSAVLHYGHAGEPNSSTIRDGSMCLYDMGAEYHGYTADVTCSFPANGRFTQDQKIVYNAVLEGNRAVIAAMKPGVQWIDMHLLAERHILKGLLEGGLLHGTLEELVENRIGGVFFPHGLGHLLGLNTHDVGGFLDNAPKKVHSLRTTRTLKAGMVITVEPGCYFIKHLLNEAQKDPVKSKFFNWSVIDRFRNFGGVRIEDDVLVTVTGSENLSSSVPRTVEEIESFMKKN